MHLRCAVPHIVIAAHRLEPCTWAVGLSRVLQHHQTIVLQVTLEPYFQPCDWVSPDANADADGDDGRLDGDANDNSDADDDGDGDNYRDLHDGHDGDDDRDSNDDHDRNDDRDGNYIGMLIVIAMMIVIAMIIVMATMIVKAMMTVMVMMIVIAIMILIAMMIVMATMILIATMIVMATMLVMTMLMAAAMTIAAFSASTAHRHRLSNRALARRNASAPCKWHSSGECSMGGDPVAETGLEDQARLHVAVEGGQGHIAPDHPGHARPR